MKIEEIRPGDVVAHDLCDEYDADYPMLVIAVYPNGAKQNTAWDVSTHDIVGLSMLPSGVTYFNVTSVGLEWCHATRLVTRVYPDRSTR